MVVVAGMAARNLGGFLVLALLIAICEAAFVFQPINDAHRSAALELFTPDDGSFSRLITTFSNLNFDLFFEF